LAVDAVFSILLAAPQVAVAAVVRCLFVDSAFVAACTWSSSSMMRLIITGFGFDSGKVFVGLDSSSLSSISTTIAFHFAVPFGFRFVLGFEGIFAVCSANDRRIIGAGILREAVEGGVAARFPSGSIPYNDARSRISVSTSAGIWRMGCIEDFDSVADFVCVMEEVGEWSAYSLSSVKYNRVPFWNLKNERSLSKSPYIRKKLREKRRDTYPFVSMA
jgi:hypothetical protein